MFDDTTEEEVVAEEVAEEAEAAEVAEDAEESAE